MTILLLLSALTLSGIAAWYAIAGLMAIFAALPIPIMIMGGALEAAKLVVASWIYNNWKRIPFLMKTYFTVALVVLMLLTSMGIFGFLSKAHLDQTMNSGDNVLQIELIDGKIAREQQRIDDANKVLFQLDEAVNVLIDYDRIRGKDGAIAVREGQKEERANLSGVIDEASDIIAGLKQEKLTLSKEALALEAEVGPIKYIAALIYGEEESKTMLEEAVRIVILMIVFVFDPLAVLMVMAASREISGRRKVTEEVTERKSYEQTRAQKIVDNVPPSFDKEPEPKHHEINVKDDITFADSIDEEASKGMRKAGRYLSEVDTQKSSRAQSFQKNASIVEDGAVDETAPFVISDKD